MRVLNWFSGVLSEGRGTPSRARNLARHLARRPGVESLVLSRDEGEVPGLEGVEHRGFTDPTEGLRLLHRTVEEFRPELVYGHTHKAMAPLAALERGAQTLGAPPVTVVDLHGDLAGERLEQTWRPRIRRWAAYLRTAAAERRDAPRIDAFTAASHPLADRFGRYGRPVRVIWGGVDLELFRPSGSARPASDGGLHLGYAGNFRPYQGIGTLLDAAERLQASGRAPRLTLVGDLEPFPEVAARALRLFGDRLTLHGQVAYERVPEILGGVDVLVVPRPRSRSALSGFPSKLAEYLALGRPVVATRVGDQERVIDDGVTGLLVPPSDPAALAQALVRLEEGELRRRLGKAGRRFAEARLGWERLATELVEFLAATVAASPAASAAGAPR